MIKLHPCHYAPILACSLHHRHTDATLTSRTVENTSLAGIEHGTRDRLLR